MRVTVTSLVCDGLSCDCSVVVSRFEWTGTHKGTFLGVPATRRPARVWGTVIDRLEKGRIKDTRIIMDIFGLMMQFGVIAPPGRELSLRLISVTIKAMRWRRAIMSRAFSPLISDWP